MPSRVRNGWNSYGNGRSDSRSATKRRRREQSGHLGRCGDHVEIVRAPCFWSALSHSWRRAAGLLRRPSVPTPPGPPGTLGPLTSPKPATGAIEHATGATDVVLRLDEGGGFMIRGGGSMLVPPFTLYGDGTVVFRNPTLEPPPAVGPVMVANPLRTARLDEDQIQELLNFALTEGGLGVAKLQYDNPMIADAGTRDLHDPGRRARQDGERLRARARRSERPGPAGTGRIHEAVRAAHELRPERHVRDGRLRPERISRDPAGHRRLPRRSANRVALGRHHARRLRRGRGHRRAADPGHDRGGARASSGSKASKAGSRA